MKKPDHILADIRLPKQFLLSGSAFRGTDEGDFLRGDVEVTDGALTGMRPTAETGGGYILLPKLVEAHCHLDKCHTVHRMANVGGDLTQAIEAQRADKIHWTDSDIRSRAKKGLDEFQASGTGHVRSHVDWGTDASAPRSWSILQELAQEKNGPALQLAALTSVAQMADREFTRQVAKSIPEGHALGAFIFAQPELEDGLREIFRAATETGLLLDFHVDEGLDSNLNGLELIADIALETRYDGTILCGHAVSLSLRCDTDQRRIIEKLAKAGISIVMLPSTNLYLQGRTSGTPQSRGVTLAHELSRAGVPLVVGTDNVRDAFCPVGQHDPRRSLEIAILAAHLDPPFGQWVDTITTNAAQAIGLPKPTLNGAAIETLLLCEASDFSGFITNAAIHPATTLLEV